MGFRVNDSIRDQQIQRIKALRKKRDQKKAAACLEELNKIATGGHNIMPAVLDAVENYCTVGEIANELRKVYGEHK
jgi:methylmalonyl-CoA mutase N-terminal domain/subunit